MNDLPAHYAADSLKAILAKAPPLTRIIHAPPCTADLSPQTRFTAFFFLYVSF
jgi:hypothetical protein